MKKVLLFLGIFSLLMSCSEISKFYTSEFKLSYARPIGIMMSHEFDSLNLNGKGIKIGVIDAGFDNFKSNEFTRNLKVVAYKNFITNDTSNFFSNKDNDHGTIVAKSIGGKNGNKVHGLAFEAEYYLAKTDIGNKEPYADEVRLIKAIDWLIEQDVKLINISLGYTVFDDNKNYTNKDLNGKTALSSKYIDSLLNSRKDIIIIVSAGNEGNKNWKHLTFPSDVKDVITVGSTDFDGNIRYKTSGLGVDYVDYIKPEVVTYPTPPGNSNTAPIITGLVATLLQIENLDRQTLKKVIIESSSNFNSPNKEIGYGVPNTKKILEKLKK